MELATVEKTGRISNTGTIMSKEEGEKSKITGINKHCSLITLTIPNTLIIKT